MNRTMITALAITVLSVASACAENGNLAPVAPPAETTSSIGRSGSPSDTTTHPTPLIFLGGGSTDVDEAMARFVRAADQGNVSVIRASGSTGYNDYLLQLADAASVETFLINSREKSDLPGDNETLSRSEALFVAGGDQWNYTLFWSDTRLSVTVARLFRENRVPIGGTSAGAMIWGGRYFDASGRSVTSAQALAEPLASDITLRPALFGTPDVLLDRVVDTHFSERNREGRLMTFLARARSQDYLPKGIGIDERTALIIDEDGIGTVYGGGFVWMYLPYWDQGAPETMQPDQPLTWDRNGRAVLVWKLAPGDRYDFRTDRPLDRPSSYHAYVRNGVFFIEAVDPSTL